jgi:hypothetical protein
MSHHYSGPNATFPRGDARLDLTDLYAFPKPEDASRSILIMNFHPSASVVPPRPTPAAEPFAPDARYELRIDTNGDAVADITYQLRFSSSGSGGQTATLRTFEGAEPPGKGEGARVIVEGVPVSMGQEARAARAGDHGLFVGRRSDPFFFDVLGVLNNLQITGDDFFADKDIYGIVLDIPNSVLGPRQVGLWVRALVPADGAGGGWVQVERGARPAQTPFLTGDQNEAYRAAEPPEDGRFVAVFAHSLEHTGGYTPGAAMRAAETMLPDVMRYDPRRPASFPDNGRSLRDDVLDAFLAILTNGKVKGDGVGPHSDLLAEFPYLGPPHGVSGSAPGQLG